MVSFCTFLLDFLLKSYLKDLGHTSIPLIKNILHITIVFNRGAVFGIFPNKGNLLVYLSFAFIVLFLVFIRREKMETFLIKFAYGLVLGGALSNFLDRILYGYVIDYIDIRIWPVFNLSDLCISTGVALIIFNSFRSKVCKRSL
ncbi:MAG: signal peptidase II [Candidatus Omnitrophota bacterium]|nr:signal peptidase II [Candidatus Omnitrophota bacterium]RKY33508.1 MAG: signal peptidase II [Candidatus Omnitrophota bacterium]RKY37338.1 MAG: signal peptidase II [Candidatus Omnitrophota bacterium]RKY46093.1 MAG: signal peptidase II [Candidatus Omnitrophota bacterium]